MFGHYPLGINDLTGAFNDHLRGLDNSADNSCHPGPGPVGHSSKLIYKKRWMCTIRSLNKNCEN